MASVPPSEVPLAVDVPVVAPTPGGGLPGPVTMQRRLWVLLPLSGLSITLVWGALLQSVIARQVGTFPGGTGAGAAGLLGIVLTVAALFSAISQPIAGRLSDRTRIRFLGRRNIWILVAPIVAFIALMVTAFSPNLLFLSIAVAITVWPLNAYQAAQGAVTPERVPVNKRGRLAGVGTLLGVVGIPGGATLGALIPSIPVVYAIVGGQLVVVGAIFAFLTRDASFGPPERSAAEPKIPFPTFRTNPDFWWVFIGRFLSFTGYTLATGLNLFVLRDYIQVGDGSLDAARLALPQVLGISTLALIVSSLAGGILADKLGRTKLFVIISSLIFVPAGLVLATTHTMTSALVGLGLTGFAFGAYVAVDGILITRVLSSADNAGRDLGVLNLANSGPQIIAPAIAGAVVAALGYPWLFILVVIASLLGAVAVGFVRTVR